MSSTPFRLLTASDLHRHPGLFGELVKAVTQHQPEVVALVGDILNASGSTTDLLSPRTAARLLAGLPCREVVFVRGNHEDGEWLEFFKAWPHDRRPMRALHASMLPVGPVTLVGFPCLLGDELPFVASLAELGDERPELAEFSFSHSVYRWLKRLVPQAGPPGQAIWLMHEPPSGLPIASESPIISRLEWAEAIQRFQPRLTISGHDHGTPQADGIWHAPIGRTMCFNAGQTFDGPLHYLLVEAFPETTQPTPRIRVTRHPHSHQSVELGPEGWH
ncbi:MAG: metallophosphoesterase [Verrucomicrobia bacterium]|nr:metallophosphoesterase [Verrucomicrobiota bacterium]